ncbi:M15 family metallopeptidase [bacterium]|nr:M15 family metallopeptidase [bacterium]
MNLQSALYRCSKDCPRWILDEIRLVKVPYVNFDLQSCCGYLLLHKDLVSDIQFIFQKLYETKFPIHSILPLSDPKFWNGQSWCDDLSMNFNNSSSFNYRKIGGKNKLSTHALAMAIDINPMQNPWIYQDKILPKQACYDTSQQGTILKESYIVDLFEERGFFWGGNFNEMKDYHHFEKKIKSYEKYFEEC